MIATGLRVKIRARFVALRLLSLNAVSDIARLSIHNSTQKSLNQLTELDNDDSMEKIGTTRGLYWKHELMSNLRVTHERVNDIFVFTYIYYTFRIRVHVFTNICFKYYLWRCTAVRIQLINLKNNIVINKKYINTSINLLIYKYYEFKENIKTKIRVYTCARE
jgi:hypothetical protein